MVRFDVPRLGDIAGLRGVHLQCHIGTDTVSLARLGRDMTGLDFAGPRARSRPADWPGAAPATISSSPTSTAPRDGCTPASFDLVYTGIGALCWLPTSAGGRGSWPGCCAPGGRLFIREGHPMLWTVGRSPRRALAVELPVLRAGGPMVFDEGGTYVTRTAEFSTT